MVHRMRRFIPALFVIGITIATLGQINSSTAHAASTPSQAITLSPASTDVAVDPGATASKTVDIINSGNNSFNVTTSRAPYYVSGLDYDPHFTQLPGTVDASAWVHLSVNTTTVAANTTITMPYTVEVPAGTPAGGYYAVIFVETSTDDAKTGVVSHNRVGDILYITVNGNIKSGGNITGDALPSFSFIGSIPITTKISNSGGVHFITQAVYTVTDMTGHKVFTATTERYILPQTEREITSTWSPQSVFGIFTVHRSATIAGVVTSLPDQKIIVINPWLFVVAAFLIGILIGIPVQKARRRAKQK
jgi:hypothetical protein